MNKYKFLVKVIIFCTIITVCLAGLTRLFRPYNWEEISDSYYEYPKDTFDVICLGQSSMLNAFQPMELWREYGVTSFSLATGGQVIESSYYLVKNAIKRDHPKVICLDVGSIYKEQVYRPVYLHYIIDSLPTFSLERYEMIMNCVVEEDRMDFWNPFRVYHSRWKSFEAVDFVGDPKEITLGAKIETNYFEAEPFGPIDSNHHITISKEKIECLKSINELCKSNDVKLLLVIYPILGEGYYSPEDYQKYYAASKEMESIAKELSLPIANMVEKTDEIGLDYKTDSYDGGHYCITGAKKVTHYLYENYIKQLNPEYRETSQTIQNQFDQKLIEYDQMVSEQSLRYCYVLEDYLTHIKELSKDDKYLVAIMNRPHTFGEVDESLSPSLEKVGLEELVDKPFDEEMAIVFLKGEKVYEDSGFDASNEYFVYNNQPIELRMDQYNCYFIINNNNYSVNNEGLNIVVYDLEEKRLVDAANFDLTNYYFACTHERD